MLQRPVTPPGTLKGLPLTSAPPARSARLTRRRQCGGAVVAFSVVALGGIFLLWEWHTNTSVEHSSAGQVSSATVLTEAVVTEPPVEAPHDEPAAREYELTEGLRMFDSFQEYVVSQERNKNGSTFFTMCTRSGPVL